MFLNFLIYLSNGKLFKEFLHKFPHLTVVNATQLCEGLITRRRMADGKLEEAVLDFFVVCKEILKFVVNMVVDDDKKLTRFTKKKIVESDHSPLILNLDMKPPEKSPKRMEIFN